MRVSKLNTSQMQYSIDINNLIFFKEDTNMDNVFGAQDTMNAAVNTGAEVGGSVSKAEKKAKFEAIRNAYIEELSQNPEIKEREGIYSDSIEVVNTLGYGKGGNIIVDKVNSKKDENGRITKDGRVIIPTPKIVGYVLKNIGSETIPYKTEVYTQNEQGVYVGEVVEKQFAPGETIQLNRKWMTAFCASVEIAFKLANGKMVESSKKSKTNNPDEKLSAYYFTFDKEIGSDVNNDEIKLSIGTDRKIAPEYLETFGYLANEPQAKERASRKNGEGVGVSAMAASYIRKLIRESGQI